MVYKVFALPGGVCRFCEKARDLLDRSGTTYEWVLVYDRKARADIKTTAEMNTFPIIYEGSRLVGGYKELLAELHGDIPGVTF